MIEIDKKAEAKLDSHETKIHALELQLTKIEGTVEHIKARLDNGISETVQKIWQLIQSDVMPAVKESQFYVGKVKWFFFFVTVIVVGGGIAKVFLYWLTKGA